MKPIFYSLAGVHWMTIGNTLQKEYTIPFKEIYIKLGGVKMNIFVHIESKKDLKELETEALVRTPRYGNPLISHKFGADPNVMVYQGKVYIYLTNDMYDYDEDGNVLPNTYGNINTITIISSEDLANWTDHGHISVAGPDGAANWATQSWAVAVTYKNIDGKDKFFLYFSNNGSNIGVLTSDTPIGPWIDPINKPLIDKNIPGTEGVIWVFDPAVLLDDDGEGYLYFGGGLPGGENRTQEQAKKPKTARVIKLSTDMINTEGEAKLIDAPFMFESSGFHKHNGKYYYSYSTNFVGTREIDDPKHGEIAYMISDNPMGPFAFVNSILKNPSVFFDIGGNNHQDFFKFKGQWYIAYHAQTLAKALGTVKGYRSPHINKVEHDEKGYIKEIKADMDGVPQTQRLNPYKRNEAETIAWHTGISTERSEASGNYVESINNNITDINNGDWLAVSNVDFGANGPKSFIANVASAIGGAIEIRLNGPKGKRIGTLNVNTTGGEQDWELMETAVESVVGIHHLFLTFVGSNEENLFNIDYWKFTSN